MFVRYHHCCRMEAVKEEKRKGEEPEIGCATNCGRHVGARCPLSPSPVPPPAARRGKATHGFFGDCRYHAIIFSPASGDSPFGAGACTWFLFSTLRTPLPPYVDGVVWNDASDKQQSKMATCTWVFFQMELPLSRCGCEHICCLQASCLWV